MREESLIFGPQRPLPRPPFGPEKFCKLTPRTLYTLKNAQRPLPVELKARRALHGLQEPQHTHFCHGALWEDDSDHDYFTVSGTVAGTLRSIHSENSSRSCVWIRFCTSPNSNSSLGSPRRLFWAEINPPRDFGGRQGLPVVAKTRVVGEEKFSEEKSPNTLHFVITARF